MKFPHDFFYDEVREGFYVSGHMKRMWAAQIEVLEEIDRVCQQYNIRWFGDCGTLLGAVRHGGYIPWDDDLDICMLRDDYERFNRYAIKDLPEGYVVTNIHSETAKNFITRVNNSACMQYTEEFLNKYHDCCYIAGIDIFPLDFISSDEKKAKEHRELLNTIMSTYCAISEADKDILSNPVAMSEFEQLAGIKLDKKKPLKRQINIAIDNIMKMYPSSDAKEVVLAPYWALDGSHVYPIRYFEDTVKLDFEGFKLPAPVAYDAVLKIEYGNYMTVHKGGSVHGYPHFKEQEEYLIRTAKEYPFIYKFDKSELNNDERAEYQSPKQQTLRYVEIMHKTHSKIKDMLIRKSVEMLYQLLEVCQNGAIRIGNMIDECYGEGRETVHRLEEYCEVVYQVFEQLQNEETWINVVPVAQIFYDALEDAINEVFVSANTEFKREIVFLVSSKKDWKIVENIYYSVVNEDNNVYIVSIPYHERSGMGDYGCMHDEKAEYPQELGVIGYEEYNLELRHPDVIYITDSSDEYNFTRSILPYFYSSNIKKFTEKLIYVPNTEISDFTSDDEREIQTMRYYCTMPGVVHSDYIFVQSEQMKTMFAQRLAEWAGEDTKEIWDNKLVVYDLLKSNTLKNSITKREAAIPEAIGKVAAILGGRMKKLVLLYTSVTAFSQYKERAVAKIKQVMDVFDGYRDNVAILWIVEQAVDCYLKRELPLLHSEFQGLVQLFEKSSLGVRLNECPSEDIIDFCDAYYGDYGRLARYFEILGKPVMISNVDVC